MRAGPDLRCRGVSCVTLRLGAIYTRCPHRYPDHAVKWGEGGPVPGSWGVCGVLVKREFRRLTRDPAALAAIIVDGALLAAFSVFAIGGAHAVAEHDRQRQNHTGREESDDRHGHGPR